MLEIESIGESRMVKQFNVKLKGQAESMWISEEDLLALINGRASLFKPVEHAGDMATTTTTTTNNGDSNGIESSAFIQHTAAGK